MSSSSIMETKRVLNITLSEEFGEEEEETVYFTVGDGGNCKIEFYSERWRNVNEWRILLKGILVEIEGLEKEGIIK